jgi:CBS domain-containing protein
MSASPDSLPPSAKVKDVMVSKGLLTAKETDSLAAVGHKMAWGRVRHIPVVRGQELVGIISERDLLAWRGEHGTWAGPDDRVERAMNKDPEVTTADEELAQAASRMVAARIGCLPVVQQGELVGMLTMTDLVGWHALVRFAREPSARRLARDVMVPKVLMVHVDDSLMEAVFLMADRHVRHLPVVDQDGRLVGILSERDLRALLGVPSAHSFWPAHAIGQKLVGEVMHPSVIIGAPDESWSQLVARMIVHDIGAVPIVDTDRRPIGIVSYVDLLREACRLVQCEQLANEAARSGRPT